MARHFAPSANVLARASIVSIVMLAGLALWIEWSVENSPYITHQQITLNQPIPFSHEHHVRGLGIDCRYCHTTVSESSFANIPATKTCMTCHSQIWTNAQLLEPVRQSWATNTPIAWLRVHNLPQYVYFEHSIHIQKGVGCTTCHGVVANMPLMFQHASLEMRWCLDCHRNPQKYLRPRDQVFNTTYFAPADQIKLGKQLMEKYHVRSAQALTDCWTCHR